MQSTLHRFLSLLPLVLSALTTVALAQAVREFPSNLQVKQPEVLLNSYQFQSLIQSDQRLGTLATDHSSVGGQTLTFGFSAKSNEATFFLLGSLYAEAAAYLHSGDLEPAEKRLAAIETECIKLQVPNGVYIYVSKVRNLLATQRYDVGVMGDFLALLQPLLEDYALSKGPEKHTLFRAGTWLVDLSLAAAANDKTLLKQANLLQYFTSVFQQLQAPQDVLEALTHINNIVAQEEISDQDVKRLLKLVKQIQTILG